MGLILASSSPRRAALLREAGYVFTVQPADIDEEEFLGRMSPIPLAQFLARAKAEEVARRFSDDVTLAADTVVALGETALGKPADAGEARKMIQFLGGATQVVITAIVVRCPARGLELADRAMSAVRMKVLTKAELDAYIASGRWAGKGGGYGIQDPEPIVECIAGDVTNVIGLPMRQTRALLERAGVT